MKLLFFRGSNIAYVFFFKQTTVSGSLQVSWSPLADQILSFPIRLFALLIQVHIDIQAQLAYSLVQLSVAITIAVTIIIYLQFYIITLKQNSDVKCQVINFKHRTLYNDNHLTNGSPFSVYDPIKPPKGVKLCKSFQSFASCRV